MFSRLTNFIRRDRILVPEEEERDVELVARPHTRQDVELAASPHTRRFFFGIMAGAAASAVVVPQIVALPPVNGVHFLTLDEFSNLYIKTAMEQVLRNYEREFASSGPKIGYTLNIRKPRRFVQTMSPSGHVSTMPVNLATA